MTMGIGIGLPWMTNLRGAILRANFRALPLGAAATLPGGLSYSRTTAGTVQTSASTLVTGIGVDVARIGMNGLVIEPSHTEFVLNNSDCSQATWTTAGGTHTHGQPDPSGGSKATRHEVGAAVSGRYAGLVGVSAARRCLSAWMRAYTGTSKAMIAKYHSSTIVGTSLYSASIDTTWRRMSAVYSPVEVAVPFNSLVLPYGGNLYPVVANAPNGNAGPMDIVAFLYSVQNQLFALEPVITAGSQVTTGGDRLWVPNASLVIHQGRLTQVIEYTAKCSIGGSNDSATAMRYGTGNGTNYVSVHQTTGVVSVVVGGATYTTSAGFTQAIGDVIRIVVAMGSASLVSAVTIQKNGGTPTKYVDSAPQGAITGVTTWDIACNGTASELPSSIAEVSFLPHGRMPSWAA